MTQENKELLLKDLSARLFYGVIIEGLEHPEIMTIKHLAIVSVMSTEPYKPYLRPLSSMTEEEKKEYHELCYGGYDIYFDSIDSIDWLIAHHFDFHGLIEKGLAIEVTEENNPYGN